MANLDAPESTSPTSNDVIKMYDSDDTRSQSGEVNDTTGALGKMEGDTVAVSGDDLAGPRIKQLFDEQIGAGADTLQIDLMDHSDAMAIIEETHESQDVLRNRGVETVRFFVKEEMMSDPAIRSLQDHNPMITFVSQQNMNSFADDVVEASDEAAQLAEEEEAAVVDPVAEEGEATLDDQLKNQEIKVAA